MVLEAEIAKLGPGPTLETHAWVDEVLGSADVPTQPVAIHAFARAPADGSKETHRAVSVSVRPAHGHAAPPPTVASGSLSGMPAGVPSRSARWVVVGLGGTLAGLLLGGGAMILGHRAHGNDHAVPGGALADTPLSDGWARRRRAPVGRSASGHARGDGRRRAPRPARQLSPSIAAHPAQGGRPPKKGVPGPTARPAAENPPPPTDPFHGVTGTGL